MSLNDLEMSNGRQPWLHISFLPALPCYMLDKEIKMKTVIP